MIRQKGDIMREVLISIQPKWVEKICRKEKTVEVRRTRPKCEVPFKCYIYETQGRTETPWVDEEGHYIFKGRGMVIGEFVCDKIYNLSVALDPIDCTAYFPDGLDHTEGTCLTKEQLAIYLCGGSWSGKGYGLNITDLVVYDEPRVLSEFYNLCDGYCFDSAKKYKCASFNPDKPYSCNNMKPLKRPPQSWCYIEPRQTAD